MICLREIAVGGQKIWPKTTGWSLFEISKFIKNHNTLI